jgi:hypothetical protein
MARRLGLASLVAAIGLLGMPHVVCAAPSNVSAIVGSYDCVTHGSDGLTWRFHSENRTWGSWVRADTIFAPQNRHPRDTGSTFVGFDEDAKQWNIVAIDTGGSYYTRYSRSPSFNGSHWMDGYPADAARATIGVTASGYTFDLVTPPKHGRTGWSHTVCTRAT